MIKNQHILFAFILGLHTAEAQKQNLVTMPALAIQPKVTYTDESEFVATFTSYGFKTISQISLNRDANTIGY